MGPPPRRRRRGAVLLPPAGDEVLAPRRRGQQGRRRRRVEGLREGEARRIAAVQAARGDETHARVLPPRRQGHRLAHARVPPPARRHPHQQPICCFLSKKQPICCSPCDLPCRGAGRGHGLGGLPHFQEDEAGPWRQRRRRGGGSFLTDVGVVVRHRQLLGRRQRG